MHREPRRAPILFQVVHVNVGPEIPKGADALVRYLAGISGGYHKVIDNAVVLRTANDDEMVYGAKGGNANRNGLHYCLIGRADQTAQQWDDAYSRGELDQLAHHLAWDSAMYGIDVGHTRGVCARQCGHHDVTLAFGVTGGHYDPGPAFPWDRLIAHVRDLRNPKTPSTPAPAPTVPVPGPLVRDYREEDMRSTLLHIGPLDGNGNGYGDWDPGFGRDPVIVGCTLQGPNPAPGGDGYWYTDSLPIVSAQPNGGRARVSIVHGKPGTHVGVNVTVA